VPWRLVVDDLLVGSLAHLRSRSGRFQKITTTNAATAATA
jgi:hypothetical protein